MTDLYTIKQLDKKLIPYLPLKGITIPLKGWINAIRTTLGMNQTQLAKHLGLTLSRIRKIEKSEVNKTLKLSTLEKVAEKLGCEVHYVLLPKEISFSELIHQQALKITKENLSQSAHHMLLEDQSVKNETQEQIDLLAQEILHQPLKGLWDHEI